MLVAIATLGIAWIAIAVAATVAFWPTTRPKKEDLAVEKPDISEIDQTVGVEYRLPGLTTSITLNGYIHRVSLRSIGKQCFYLTKNPSLTDSRRLFLPEGATQMEHILRQVAFDYRPVSVSGVMVTSGNATGLVVTRIKVS